MLGLLLGAALSAQGMLAPQPQGVTTVTALLGQPFSALRAERGFSWGDTGLGLELSTRGVLRPMARARLELLHLGPASAGLRGAAGAALPTFRQRARSRMILRTAEAELAGAFDLSLSRRFCLELEGGMLAVTDFTTPHGALFALARAGAGFAASDTLGLVAQAGVLRGARGRSFLGSAGAALRF